MTAAPPSPRPRTQSAPLTTILLLAMAGGGAFGLWRIDRHLTELASHNETMQTQVTEALREITRMRIEQTVGGQGPAALLERLHSFAPLLASARTTEPDYQSAKTEMGKVILALPTYGQDSWRLVTEQLEKANPQKDFDTIKWLLRAALAIDPKAGVAIAKDVLLGSRLPSPRLRWLAADELLEHDRSLAQTLLRRILLTESSRGIDPSRAAVYGASVPDAAAYATTGFHNFAQRYVTSGDPELENTLLAVLGRTEQDSVTLQCCIETLGERHCERAIEPIRRFCQNPPRGVEDPLFLMPCYTALDKIQGKAAQPFFNEMLEKITVPKLAEHVRGLLKN